jgi:hypothetical protein
MEDKEMSDNGGIPWPVWAVVTLGVAAIGAYAVITSKGSASQSVVASRVARQEVQETVISGVSRYAAALLELDTSELSDAFDGAALHDLIAIINNHRSLSTRVDADSAGVTIDNIELADDGNTAQVYAKWEVRKFTNKDSSYKCVGVSPGATIGATYSLRKNTSGWRIYSISGLVSGGPGYDTSKDLPCP